MRFIIDSMYPRSLAEMLSGEGHECFTASRLKISSATDQSIWQRAEELEAVVISKDSDFGALAAASRKARLIHDRGGNMSTTQLVERFRQQLPQILAALEAGERIVEFR